MTRRPRRNHTAGFKAKAALKGDKTLAQLAEQFDVHPNQIMDWKHRLQEGAAGVFGEDKADERAKVDVIRMRAKIGEPTLENDFLEGALTKAGSPRTGLRPWGGRRACRAQSDDRSRARATHR
jgi:transposase